MLRRSLKSNLKDDAAKRDQTQIKIFFWANGEILRKYFSRKTIKFELVLQYPFGILCIRAYAKITQGSLRGS